MGPNQRSSCVTIKGGMTKKKKTPTHFIPQVNTPQNTLFGSIPIITGPVDLKIFCLSTFQRMLHPKKAEKKKMGPKTNPNYKQGPITN